jgi:Na+-transporting NADH:ubiquinone oxidoreductase subunit NqrE
MIENIVIGEPIIEVRELLGENFIEKTYFTQERFLPKILKDCNLVASTSWVRKNKPEYFAVLDNVGTLEVSLGKKKKPIYVIIGE